MSESSDRPGKTSALIVAAGSGQRSGLDQPKQFEVIGGKPMIGHCVETFHNHPGIDEIWIVIGEGQQDQLNSAVPESHVHKAVIGGKTRQQSVLNGLKAIAENGGTGRVLIHDAARPFLPEAVLERLQSALDTSKAAIPVLPVVDTMIEASDASMQNLVDREALYRVQTPQAFDFGTLLDAHKKWNQNWDATDDAQVMKAAGHNIITVVGDEKLKKYTTANDFRAARSGDMSMIRTGTGFDVHQLVVGEELWLGGIHVPYDKGLAGHSDADVLLHALTDALLGAAGEGDIGDHFPPSDPQWRDASSGQFVKHAAALINQKGGVVHNVDMTLICEQPKIKPHRNAMRENIAKMLDLSIDQVSVKATTTEGLGFTGRKEGIAAQAIATISMEMS